MHATRKFLFDTDFAPDKDPPALLTPEQIVAAFEQGREQGQREAEARFEAEGQATLSAIRDALERAVGSLEGEIARVESEAIALAADLVRVYTDATLARDPAPLIASLVRKAAETAGNIPALSIAVGPKLTVSLREAIEQAVAEAGFSGRVSLIEDDALASGDVRIEWPDGGFKRSRADLDLMIDRLIATHAPSQTEPNP